MYITMYFCTTRFRNIFGWLVVHFRVYGTTARFVFGCAVCLLGLWWTSADPLTRVLLFHDNIIVQLHLFIAYPFN